jgi:hypothetical protein
VSGCSTAVRSGTVRMVRGTRVPSSGGVFVMRTVGVTTLNPQDMGKPEPSSMDSLRMVCHDGGPL